MCPSLTIILRGAHGLLSFTFEKTHVAAVSPALWVKLARRKGVKITWVPFTGSVHALRGQGSQSSSPDGPLRIDFCHHLFPPGDRAVVANFPEGVVLDDVALSEFSACSTLVKLVTLWGQHGKSA